MKYVLLASLFFSTLLAAQPPGYTTFKEITVSNKLVSGREPLVNYPLLIHLEDATLRTVDQGGNMESANGYDVVFTAADGATVLSHQMVEYDGTAGRWVGYVNVPALDNKRDTRLIVYYGNHRITTDPSTPDTWGTDYLGVYGFEGNTLDVSNAGTHLTDFRTTSIDGKVGLSRGLLNPSRVLSRDADVAGGQYLKAPDNLLTGANSFTWSGWIRLHQTQTNWERIFDFGSDVNRNFFFTPSSDVGNLGETRARITNTGIPGETGPIVANATNGVEEWVHWAITIDDVANSMTIYRNGQRYGNTVTLTITPAQVEPTINNYFGRSQYDADHLIDADYDEMRMATQSRSAAWIATEYRNQNDPLTFAVAGPAQVAYQSMEAMAALSGELMSYAVEVTPQGPVAINWATSREENNASFTAERSVDGIIWETVATLQGAGTTATPSYYLIQDPNAGYGQVYYRLRQTDFDGYDVILGVRSTWIQSPQAQLSVYPNPTRNQFTVSTDRAVESPVAIYDISGTDVTSRVRPVAKGNHQETFDLAGLPSGTYIVRAGSATQVLVKL
ncbi:DUF2341 domain-containing protein [Lewinella sp. IMCC34191]|uniref:DUF2341 domain-containing protein n=1 Tax=Lewinella sp. IMCC34191 TaxID=2259172 RepID=UPI000E280831|nr:DUF2341 domain-containing protein [Lewinella sp. IMCC34191]